jgi:MFS family permease
MRRRATTWLAAGLWLLWLLLVVALVVMKTAGWHGSNNTSDSGLSALLFAFLAFATMGALVAAHVPRNPLGWLFMAIALGVAVGGIAENLAFHGLVDDPGSVPGALVWAWIYAWIWNPTIGLIGFVLLLYPTGRVPGPRWRPVLWALVIALGLVTTTSMLHPGSLDTDTRRLPDNPIGVGAVGDVLDAGGNTILGGTAFVLVLVCAGSVVVRFRRSIGDERQQLKWMTLAAIFLAAAVFVPSVLGLENTDLLFSLAYVLFPLAVGVALFKYRLYDIDRLINRTLVYATLTAVLGGVYVGLVLGGQALFSSFAGSGNLAIAVSTLLVAAMFLPLRSRVQRFVDRRFYRRRYDAQRTLEGFGSRLREQVHLETLGTDLTLVVQETIQPSHVSLWLRSGR